MKKKQTLLILGSSSILLIAGFLGLSSFDDTTSKKTEPTELNLPVEETVFLFDIPVNDYEIETNTVEKNEFLSTILQRYQINLSTISELADKSKEVYDVRRISAGNPYTVFKNKEGL